MPGDEPIEHGIEFCWPLLFDWRARWPDFENISGPLHFRMDSEPQNVRRCHAAVL